MSEHFTITAQQIADPDRPAATLLQLSGEFDLDARETLRAALMQPIEAGRDVLVDFSAVTFLDSEALGALVDGYNAAEAAGVAFRLTGARGSARRVLQITGVLGLTSTD